MPENSQKNLDKNWEKSYQKILARLESGFLGFRVKKRRVSFLLIAIIVALGAFSLSEIPKESSPDIEFGIIQVTTAYPGANPVDIDNVITQKIEDEIKDIDGIKKITSQSRIGISSISVELQNDANTTQLLVDLKDATDKANLPSDAEDPIVTEVSTDNERMFDLLLFADAEKFPLDFLRQKAENLKDSLDGVGPINRIDIGIPSEETIEIRVDKARAETAGLTLSDISQTLRTFNQNLPLGTHEIWPKTYDFRIQSELKSLDEIRELPISLGSRQIRLGDIAQITRDYNDDRISRYGQHDLTGKNFITLTINKSAGANIFQSSSQAKELLQKELQKQNYAGLSSSFGFDLAETISEDYDSLATNGLQTIILVFLALLFFVGLKESLIASITIPVAFLITFGVLNQLGLSLNFLTNFSLIICFGIAIDTTIVIIEWAHERMRMGYDPKTAVLLAVRDFKRPVIAGTSTTLVVFIPMLSLPGVTGKFLAYIPITIFVTLIATLFLALTINSALFTKLSKPKKTFEDGILDPEFMADDEKILLNHERQGKTLQTQEHRSSRRQRFLDKISSGYANALDRIMASPRSRLLTIRLPVVALILSFVVISPRLGFTLFPSGDSEFLFITVEAEPGRTTESLAELVTPVESALAKFPEIDQFYFSIRGDTLDGTIELFPKGDRKRNSFEIENQIATALQPLVSRGYTLSTEVQRGGPPAGSPVGIKLQADSNEQFSDLLRISREFQDHLESLPGAKNPSNTAEQNPGQIIFTRDLDALLVRNLSPALFRTELLSLNQGLSAGTLKEGNQSLDIKVLYEEFDDGLTPQEIQSRKIGPTKVGTVTDYSIDQSISLISREDTKITISVNSDVEDGLTPDQIQNQFEEFARGYDFPAGISRSAGGEEAENADLIQATVVAFIIALLLIFSILTLQFNSFSQPATILYSVLMGILGANIGLRVTGNPYSMAFGIGFIALTGIVVNDAIVFISRANQNQDRGMTLRPAIKEAAKSRLQPIILTTITTILGLSSIVREDAFFAGLAFTIMFGLFLGSSATLFSIPAVLHDLPKIKNILRRTILPLALFALVPAALRLAIQIFLYLFGVTLGSFSMPLLEILAAVSALAAITEILRTQPRARQTFFQKILGTQIVDAKSENAVSLRQSLRRLAIKRGGILIPVILAATVSPAFAVLLVIILGRNIVTVRKSDDNLTLHDRRANTKVLEKN